VPFSSHISSFRSGSRTRVVHLLPLPSDDGCSQHFGFLQSTFHHDIHSDLKSVATSLNFKDLVAQELPVAAVVLPPQRRHPGQQGENFEDQLKWKELGVKFPPPQDSVSSCVNLEGHGLRFTPAVPCADFVSRTKKGTPKGAGGAAAQFQGMSKSKKKSAKLRAKRTSSDAAADAEGSEVETFLKPCDIARARLFLCFDSDVKDGKLPVVHMEVDPLHPLAESIAEFEKKFSGHKYVRVIHFFCNCVIAFIAGKLFLPLTWNAGRLLRRSLIAGIVAYFLMVAARAALTAATNVRASMEGMLGYFQFFARFLTVALQRPKLVLLRSTCICW